MRVAALIMAAGRGERMGGALPKCFLPLAGRPLVAHALAAFARTPEVETVILVAPPGWTEPARELLAAAGLADLQIVGGGESRMDSVERGLQALEADAPELVAIHDGARPLISPETISATLAAAAQTGAALAATPLTDTLKRANADLLVTATPPRENLWRAQTPQCFRYDLVCAAHQRAREEHWPATDDGMLVEKLGHPVQLVPTRGYNPKMTTPEDMQRAEHLLSAAAETRVGHGYDLHRLVTGRPLVLGGVTIPHEQGLLGHSDADAACHALADALLGAVALGDIGAHFPDTDPTYAGADSTLLLAHVAELLRQNGWRLVNCDLTIQAQAPRLRPHVEQMRTRLAAALGVEVTRVSVKATTMEGLGPIGEEQAIAAHAVVLLQA
ncbi:MAG TPA: 2-C-methyl-D-erythritol 4-phosphate cytidylyltransferase [Armatimonadota bacterium]|jgi:2-C-methyl-D-erythritol 4-phosphate cytidylyltransferase/2-C-methyl-D-erythritol 2,4-cyclodiphosphate synthase